MAHKYGLFNGATEKPMQTFEGDSMSRNGDFVYVYRNERGTSGHQKQVQVAAVKLDGGQCVKELS